MARNKYPEETVNRILQESLRLFLEKGYEHTTIQDIVDALGDLSKGAIYHHYKSKEEIFYAVVDRLFADVGPRMSAIRDREDLTGLQKLQCMFQASIQNPNQEQLFTAAPNLLKNPPFLAAELDNIVDEVAPQFVEPVIRQGVADGSIKTEYPREMAQVLLLLSNIWLNPLVYPVTREELDRKFQFMDEMLKDMGLPILDSTIRDQMEKLRASFDENRK